MTFNVKNNLNGRLDERKQSVIVHSLFSAWMLSFLFEGRILYALCNAYDLNPIGIIFGGIAALFTGLFSCGFFIKSKKTAKHLFLFSYVLFIATSAVFFFPPSAFWYVSIFTSALFAGGCVAAWGYYFKSGTPKNERIKTAADVLIFSNVLMILLNITAIHISPYAGLTLSILMLLCAFLFARRLPINDDAPPVKALVKKESLTGLFKPLAFLSLFIVIITIDSGLMYQVINPAFFHIEWLTSWYWALPYIAALFIMKNLHQKTNRTYTLYLAIAMIGFAFIAFMMMERSVTGYLVINTLMLGAFGIYDLFWWSILGEMLESHKNPAKVFGIGLSANVLGVLLGGLIGNGIDSSAGQSFNSTLLALAVICITLALLPLLQKHLSVLLKDHAFQAEYFDMSVDDKSRITDRFAQFANLAERERQVAVLLLERKAYKEIAGALYISENTVKYYVKSIYFKFSVQSRAELIDLIMEHEKTAV